MKTDKKIQQEAGQIRDFLRTKKLDLGHMECLELAARLAGHRDLHASQSATTAAVTETAEEPQYPENASNKEKITFLKKHKQSAAVALLVAAIKDPDFVGRYRLREFIYEALLAGEFNILGTANVEKAIEGLGYKTITFAVERGPEIKPVAATMGASGE